MFKQERIKVKCNRCGGEMFSDEFILDPDFKMAVCKNCIKEKKQRQQVWEEVGKQKEEAKRAAMAEEPKEPAKPKPAGWDMDDEVLEKLSGQKQRAQAKEPVFEVLSSGKLKCSKCGYAFKYDELNHRPANCPYCFNPVKRKTGF